MRYILVLLLMVSGPILVGCKAPSTKVDQFTITKQSLLNTYDIRERITKTIDKYINQNSHKDWSTATNVELVKERARRNKIEHQRIKDEIARRKQKSLHNIFMVDPENKEMQQRVIELEKDLIALEKELNDKIIQINLERLRKFD